MQSLHTRGSKSTCNSRCLNLNDGNAGSSFQDLEESWRLKDVDLNFVVTAQHYGTAIYAVAIIVALAVVHYSLEPKQRVFFVYDATISCKSTQLYCPCHLYATELTGLHMQTPTMKATQYLPMQRSSLLWDAWP